MLDSFELMNYVKKSNFHFILEVVLNISKDIL